MKSPYPKDLIELIAYLKKLPGVGRKTAERFAFKLLEWESPELKKLAKNLSQLKDRIIACSICGCLVSDVKCQFCHEKTRDNSVLCVLAYPRDVYAIEETGSFYGRYHVLGSLLCPLQGKNPDHLHLNHLKQRIETLNTKEVILALEPTLEGDATALYLKQELDPTKAKVSRLALGLPLGSSLDFIDEGTLTQALTRRVQV